LQTRLTNPYDIYAYFEKLAIDGATVRIDSETVRAFTPKVVLISGRYTFTVGDELTPARYTIMWIHTNGRWRIIEHHSSEDPEHGQLTSSPGE